MPGMMILDEAQTGVYIVKQTAARQKPRAPFSDGLYSGQGCCAILAAYSAGISEESTRRLP